MRPHQLDGPAPPEPPEFAGIRHDGRRTTARHCHARPVLLAVLGLNLLLAPLTAAPAGAQDHSVAPSAGSSTTMVLPEAIAALAKQAEAAHDKGERQAAMALQSKVWDWMDANVPSVHPLRARALIAMGIYMRGKRSSDYLNESKTIQALYAEALQRQQQTIEALVQLIEAVRILRELAKTDPSLRPELASALKHVAIFSMAIDAPKEALPAILEALQIYRDLAKAEPALRIDVATTLNNLGDCYQELGLLQEALASTREAVQIYRSLAVTSPAIRPELAKALNNLGVRYREAGQVTPALAATKEAIELFTELASSNSQPFKDDLQRARNNQEVLQRTMDLGTGLKRAIAADDLSYLNANDPDSRLRRSVVRLWPTFSGPTTGSGPLLGTGFVVSRQGDRAWIATARHVILDPSSHARPTQLQAELYSGPLPANLTTARLAVVVPSAAEIEASRSDDLVLLELKGLPADVAPLPLASNQPQGTLKVVGHPSNASPWSVLSFPVLQGNNMEEFFLVGALTPGASGSPVFDTRNQVVGLVYQTHEVGNKTTLDLVAAYGSRMIAESLKRLAASP